MGSWFIFKNEGKQQFVGSRVGGGVMREFSHREKVCPFLRVSIAKDTKVDFKLLVYALCFFISLWVVGGGEFEVIF